MVSHDQTATVSESHGLGPPLKLFAPSLFQQTFAVGEVEVRRAERGAVWRQGPSSKGHKSPGWCCSCACKGSRSVGIPQAASQLPGVHFFPVTPPGDRGVSRRGGQGSEFYVLSSEPKEHQISLSGYPTGRTGERGDRKKFYVQTFYVPFLLPICAFCYNRLDLHRDCAVVLKICHDSGETKEQRLSSWVQRQPVVFEGVSKSSFPPSKFFSLPWKPQGTASRQTCQQCLRNFCVLSQCFVC